METIIIAILLPFLLTSSDNLSFKHCVPDLLNQELFSLHENATRIDLIGKEKHKDKHAYSAGN